MVNSIIKTMNEPNIDANVSFEHMAESNKSSIKIGLYIGSFFTIGACCAFGFAMHGMEMLTKTDRKTNLLLKYADRDQEIPNQSIEGTA